MPSNLPVQLLSAALLVSTSIFLLTYDNTDTTFLQQHYKQENLQGNGFTNIFDENSKMKELAKQNENYCLNGKDRKKLSPSEQHEEFVKGPCSPIIFLPGIMGTQLHVVIDCEVMQKENPEAFESCGWNTCSGWSLLSKKPPKEFQLWVGAINSPAQIVSISEKSRCFGNLFKLSYNKETKKLERQKGFYVTWAGNTPETKKESNCGVNAITDFVNIPYAHVATCMSQGYSHLVYMLESLGYQSGITFQALPFDFRPDVQQSDTQIVTPQAINHMYKMTGKRSVLVGYSLSNLHLIESMSKLTQEEKDQKVKSLILVGPPFLGAWKSLMNILGGDPQYLVQILGINIGANFFTQSSFAEECVSGLDMLPKNTFEKFQNEPWMKELIARIEYENNYKGETNQSTKVPYDYVLPSRDEICINSDIFPARKGKEHCYSGLYNQLEDYILKITDRNFYGTQKDIEDILGEYSFFTKEKLLDQYKQSLQAKGLHNFVNPQVPLALIYGTMLPAEKQLEYYKHTKKNYNETQTFYFPDNVTKIEADGTVPTFSAIVPGLKWAHEFQNQSVKGAKPVKFYEYCSINKQSTTLYDSENEKKERVINSNSYQGIPCECQDGSSQEKCTHPCMINDKFIVQLMVDAVKSNEKSTLKEFKFTDEEILNIQYECPALKTE